MVIKKTMEELLAESLHELARQKPVDKITVREIAANAEVTTATFYNYFQDKYELIFWIYDYQVQEILIDYENGDEQWSDILREFIQLLRDDELFYRNAFLNTHGQDSLFINASRKWNQVITQFLLQQYGEQITEEIIFDLHFYIGACAHATLQWFFGKQNVTEEQFVHYLENAMPRALAPYLV